jgi:hypothetical protein
MSYPSTVCPHCGVTFANSIIARHVRGCVADPVIFAQVRELLDNHGTIISADAYRSLPAVPVAQWTLQKRFGSWLGVAAHFGLRFVDPRDVKWLKPLPPAPVEPSYLPRGLPICRVYPDDLWPGYVRCVLL